MISQSIRADDGGREGKWVALSIGLILAIAAMLLPYHQATPTKKVLADYQVSIKDLPAIELAMIGELRLAHEEIRNIHQDKLELNDANVWPDITELNKLWLAPFMFDKSWERKGKHAWSKVAPAWYQGIPELATGSVAVLLDSQASEPSMWLALEMPTPARMTDKTLVKRELIRTGWKQVVFADEFDLKHTDKNNH